MLERAGHDIDKESLQFLIKFYKHYQKHNKSPGCFKFNLRDDIDFNYSIIVNIFYISSKPVLHVINERTRYQAG